MIAVSCTAWVGNVRILKGQSRQHFCGIFYFLASLSHIQVGTNGYFSLGSRVTSCCPSLFSESSTISNIVAPFWSNIDTRTTGEIFYEVHTDKSNPDLLHIVSQFIRTERGVIFSGRWMLVVEWKDVPQYPGDQATQVSVDKLACTCAQDLHCMCAECVRWVQV